RGRGRPEDHQRVDAGAPQGNHLVRHRGVGDLEALLADDLALVRAEPALEAVDVVAAVAVVLIDDPDLRVREGSGDVAAVDRRLRLVVGLPADRPRMPRVLVTSTPFG